MGGGETKQDIKRKLWKELRSRVSKSEMEKMEKNWHERSRKDKEGEGKVTKEINWKGLEGKVTKKINGNGTWRIGNEGDE